MSSFSLYQRKEKAMPNIITVDGIAYKIDANFRNVLRIFAMLKEENIPEQKRISQLSEWFFVDEKPKNAVREFLKFVNPESEEKETGKSEEREKSFDYEFDAEQIYTSFLQDYNLDLFDAEYLHWYKFKAMLNNLSAESPFRKRIQLRFMDLNGYKGRALVDLTEAKEAVQLPVEYTDEELAELEEFESEWGRV